MVRVEPIAEVGGQPYAPGGRGMRQAGQNRGNAVSVFPGNFSASFQLSNAHPLGLKNDVLAIVEFPVSSQDSAFTLESAVKSRSRKRRHNREPRKIYFRVHRKLRSFHEDVGTIAVQTENEASLQRDAMIVKIFNYANKVLRRIERFFACTQVLN